MIVWVFYGRGHMDRSELLGILKGRGVRGESYSLEGGSRDDRITIDQIGGTWIVYYSERDKRRDERRFTDEDSACRHLLRLLCSDRGASRIPVTGGSAATAALPRVWSL